MFDLAKLMDEVALAGKQIPGISRTFGYPVELVEPPALVVAWPEIVEYDRTYRSAEEDNEELPQAMTEFTLPVFVVLGQGGASKDRKKDISRWMQGQVKRAIERYPYTGGADLWVANAVTDILTLGDGPYLATKYTVEVTTTD